MFINKIEKEYLPIGCLTRYQLDIYCMGDISIPFEEFQKQWAENNDKRVLELNKNNPIVFNRKFYIDSDKRKCVALFKREGMEWSCYYADYNPYGGGGNISLDKALDYISDPEITKIVKEFS